jgi:quinol monooxygenase YgiN
MIVILGSLRFPPENIAGLRPHMRAVAEATRARDGCHSYDLAEDVFEPGLIRFSETWPDKETLERHMQAPHMTPWREAVKAHGVLGRDFTVYAAGESWKL